MWSELLPTLVGGTLTDHDAPNDPTPIVGYKLTDDWVEVTGEAFSFGAARKYIGVSAGAGRGGLTLHTTFGMGATVTRPEAPQDADAVARSVTNQAEPPTRV